MTVSREEFTMLRDQVATNSQRLDMIDREGTRGVGIVQQQLMDLKGDLVTLTARFDHHESDHRDDARARVTGRRWLAAAVIAAIAAVDGPLVTILLSRGR